MSKTALAIVAVLLLTTVPAWLQGRFVNRWGQPANLAVAGQRLHGFPRQLGDWESARDQQPLSEAVCRELGLVEHFHRQYVHQRSRDQLDILLMVGPSGRLVRHPPSVCYANRANQQVGAAELLQVTSGPTDHEFSLLRFQRSMGRETSGFWVAYGYATELGDWAAPTSPRMTFGGAPVLYKLQVLSDVPVDGDHEQLSEFIQQFVAEFPRVLAANSTGVESKTDFANERVKE